VVTVVLGLVPVLGLVLGLGWAWSAGLQRASSPMASHHLLDRGKQQERLSLLVLAIVLSCLCIDGTMGAKVWLVSVWRGGVAVGVFWPANRWLCQAPGAASAPSNHQQSSDLDRRRWSHLGRVSRDGADWADPSMPIGW
jgi:hypothetical protein